MVLTRSLLGLVLVGAMSATSFGAAIAQEKPKRPLAIRDCVSYLRMSDMQRGIIDYEMWKLNELKKERAQRAVRDQNKIAAASEVKSDEPAIDYDVEIGKLAFTLDKDRKVLAAIGHRYGECIKAPPWSMAKAVPETPPAAKKPAAKRTTAKSSQRSTEGRGPPPQGGHSPGASGLMGVIGGGGVGIGF